MISTFAGPFIYKLHHTQNFYLPVKFQWSIKLITMKTECLNQYQYQQLQTYFIRRIFDEQYCLFENFLNSELEDEMTNWNLSSNEKVS